MAEQAQVPQMSKYHEIELSKIFDSLTLVQNLRVQLGTFFGTANLAALGIAFDSKNASLVIFAGALLFVFLLLDFVNRRALAYLVYRAVQLQQKYAPHDQDAYLAVIYSGGASLKKRVERVLELHTQEGRAREMNSATWGNLTLMGFWLPLVAGVAEVCTGVVFIWLFQWPLV